MNAKCIIAILFVLGTSCLRAQLAGLYYVGGSGDDYSTPYYALLAARNEGTTDTVVFLLRDGTYNLTYTGLPSGVEPDYPIIIKSENNDASLVNIVATISNTNLTFWSCSNLYFYNLSFKSDNLNYPTLNFDWCSNIFIENCEIYSCDMQIFEGRGSFNNNRVTHGDFVTNFGGYYEVIVENNEFFYDVDLNGYKHIVKSNLFHGSLRVESSCSLIANNIIEQGASIDATLAGHSTVFRNNFVGGGTGFFGKKLRVISNDIANSNYIEDCEYCSLVNNFFHSGTTTAFGGNTDLKMYFNNFGSDAVVLIDYSYGMEVKNNNFGNAINWRYGTPEFVDNVSHNNFYPGYGKVGLNNYHFDPMYISEENMKVNNPALTGLGEYVWAFQYDKDSLTRNQHPSIGANELFMEADTIFINCGQTVRLTTWEATESGGRWFPNYYLDDSLSVNPLATPNENITYFFRNNDLEVLDSIVIIVAPYELLMSSDLSFDCGYGAILYNMPHEPGSVSYEWNPTIGPIQWGYYLWYAFPEETTTYTLTLTHNSCGVFVDSVTLTVNYVLDAYARCDSIVDRTGYFRNQSSCENSVFWIFDEGYTTTEENPIYTFQSWGQHQIMMLARNEMDEDTVFLNVWIDYFSEIENERTELKCTVYPNPAHQKVNFIFPTTYKQVDVKLCDLTGRVVLMQSYCDIRENQEYSILVSNQKPGGYLIFIESEETKEVHKVFILSN